MPTRMRRLALLAIAYSHRWTVVSAAPSLNFPIDLQVPPVARTLQQFSFTFSESTFVVAEESISYSFLNAPAWLQFDSNSRTFFGNVTTSDAGPTTFNLIATDSSGSTSSEVTFIVTEQDGPQLGKPLLSQLSQPGRASAPASLLLYPLEGFSITFAPDTFSATNEDTSFYATSADNSPLPSWLQFDPTGLRFSGTSPPLVSPTAKPQAYGIRLIASNIVGFAEAVTSFQIVVGYKILAFAEASQTVELSQGQAFETERLRESLTIDGEPVDDFELVSVTSNAPDWAKFDPLAISLKGTPPQERTSQSMLILIDVADIYGDTTSTSINLVLSSSQSKLFSSHLGPVNVTTGQDFRYTIEASSISSTRVLVTADLTNASSWLAYDARSRTFSGSVPDDLLPGAILITLNATLGTTAELEQLTLNVLNSSISRPPSYTSRGLPSPTASPSLDVTSHSRDTSERNKRKLAIILGVVLPVLALFSFGCLVLYWCWRKRNHRRPSQREAEMDISRPVILPESEIVDLSDPQRIPQQEKPPTLTNPPHIELPWAPDSLRKSKERLSKVTTNRESTLIGSGWGDFVIRDPPAPQRSPRRQAQGDQDTPGESGDWTPFVRSTSNNLNYSRKRIPLRPTQSRVQKPSLSSRASKTLSGLSNLGAGLPVRLSGAGHGAGGTGPPGFYDVRRSWRNTVGSLASDDGRTTPFDLEAFPTPPAILSRAQPEPQEQTAKPTVRLVPSTSSSHSGSIADQRQRWVRERARERYERGSRFSHAWSTRAHSRARALESSIRSLNGAKFESFGPEDHLDRRSMQRSWSRSSSIGAPIKPDPSTRMKSPDSRLVRQPSHLRRALSTVSSGRFDSAESKSNSSWVDDLIEEEDEDGHRRWVTVDKNLQGSTPVASPALKEGEESEQGSWGKNSRTGGLGALRANIQGVGQGLPSGERRWRLGGEQAKRPISVDEGELQRSQGSQRGNLAFV